MRPRLSGGEIVIACSATRTTPMTSRNHLRGESENPVSKARYNAVICSINADGRDTNALEFTWKIYGKRKTRGHTFQLKSQTGFEIAGNTDGSQRALRTGKRRRRGALTRPNRSAALTTAVAETPPLVVLTDSALT